jgi:hypothetical protein
VSYDALKLQQTELIRKSLGGSVFVAEATANDVTTLTELTGEAPNQVHDIAALPAGYEDLGFLTDAGAAMNTETTTSDVSSWQSTQPTRSDITAETSTLQVVCQETKLLTLGLYTGSALAGIEALAGTGDLIIKKPQRPSGRFYKVLSLAVDENEFGEIYIARFLPRAKVTGRGGQSYDKSDNAIQWDVTFTGYYDATYGSSESFLFGGPGWLGLLDEMGIEQAD